MKRFRLLIIFLLAAAVYYLLATKGTGKFFHDLDYFSPLAKSFLMGRLDIPGSIENHDLSLFNGKWYPYWGPLPALLLIPFQLVMGRYIPVDYLAIVFGSLGVVLMYLIIQRLSQEYFTSRISTRLILLLTAFFAFGTSQIYVSTRSGVWFVSQVVSMVPTFLAFYILIKKKLLVKDYFGAAFFIATNLISRFSLVMLAVLLFLRLFDDWKFKKDSPTLLKKKLVASTVSLLVFAVIFAWYNMVRFGTPWDTGYLYHNNGLDPAKYLPFGLMSWQYIPRNLWLIFLELPKLTLEKMRPVLDFNMEGISIFAVSPVYLAALLTFGKNLFRFSEFRNRLIVYLWTTLVFLLFPLLLLFSPGLVQFGIRYSLDFSMILIALVIFGLEGKGNPLVVFATVVAVIANIYSVMVL